MHKPNRSFHTASVTSIGYCAFYHCTSLTSFSIPEGVTSIGDDAFGTCSSLKEILVNAGNQYYSNDEFGVLFDKTQSTLLRCPERIEGVYIIPASVTSIEGNAFSSCSSLTSITIPDGVTSIDRYVFLDCSSLTNITIPASVTSIGEFAFDWCSSLTSITIPDSVTSIGQYAFSHCSSLTSISVPESVTSIDIGAFSWCSGLTSVSIPEGLTSIDYVVFAYCSSLRNITIPSSVTSIGESAFQECSSLTSITIPDSVTSIEYNAFGGCSSLTEITFSGNAPRFGSDVFYEVTATAWYPAGNTTWTEDVMQDYGGTITWVSNEPGEPIEPEPTEPEKPAEPEPTEPEESNILAEGSCGENLTWKLEEDGVLTISGVGEMENYNISSVPWADYRTQITAVIIEEGVTSIGDDAFYECSSLTCVSIPEGVTRLGEWSFFGCSSLTSVSIPASVIGIGYWSTFLGCDRLKEIQVSKENPFYSSDAFGVVFNKEKTELIQCPCGMEGDYSIPSGVTSIRDHSFIGCRSLTGIIIPEGISSISSDAFAGCNSLTNVTIPDSVTVIDNYAFSNCNSLISITIPDSVTSIGISAFELCTSLTSVSIPEGVTSIDEYAFGSCDSLKGIWVNEENPNYSSDEFGVLFNKEKSILMQCPGGIDGEYIIPDSVTIIVDYAFSNCSSLSKVSIPVTVTSIASHAFQGCSNLSEMILTGVALSEGMTSIGAYAFYYCTNLINITIPASVTDIDEGAFRSCSSLPSITIPDSVTNIGMETFCHCSSLKEITFCGNAPRFDSDVFYGVTATAWYPAGNTTWTEDVMQDYGGDITWRTTCKAHEWGDWSITKESTCTEMGEETHTCSVCGQTEIREVEAKGHVFGEWIADGNTSHRTCAVCGFTENKVTTGGGDVEIEVPSQSDENVDVDVDHVEASDERYVLVEEVFSEEEETEVQVLKVFDINLKNDDGVHVQPDGTVKVKLPLENHKNGNYKVYRINDDGTRTDMEAKRQGSHMVFDTDHFSLYVIVEEADHTHTYTSQVTKPTCMEKGCVTHTCTICGSSYEDNLKEALGHNWDEGVVTTEPTADTDGVQTYTCTRCGETKTERLPALEPEASVTYKTASISLAGDIGLNYYVQLSDDILADEGSYMAFTVAGKTQRVPLGEALVDTDKDGNTTYRFSCKVAAKQMTDTVVGQMYTSNGPVGEEKAYSVKAYCDAAIPAYSQYEAYASLIDLMKAMLNYGAYSQIQFDYHTDNLANADLENTSLPKLTADDLAAYAHGATGSEEGIRISTVSLLLESTTTIRFYFKLDGTKSIEEYTFYVDGVETKPVRSEENTYYVDKGNVAAKDLDKMATVTVGGLTVQYCVLSYVRQVAVLYPDYYSESLIQVAKALFAYNQAANSYFSAKV